MEGRYPKEIQNLPICPHLDEICQSLKNSPSHALILTAETGAGKSTALPLALLEHFSGKILMLEPRRLAVLNIANRVSDLLSEPVGKTCGYTMRLENKVTESTRLHILTEAILTRKIQSDPLLESVSVVVIDEFHERSIHADLALAFLKESLSLRDDLYLVVMSATMDTDALSVYLGTDEKTPVYHVKGRTHEVQIEYAPSKSPSMAVLDILRSLKPEENGSILVFLPGIKEIRSVENELSEVMQNYRSEVCVLHSSIPYEEQKRILKGDTNTRRVILSSAIAETSVTVPGVRWVVDSGECRMNSYNQTVGMNQLVTLKVSLFSADQRAGRAGRLTNGSCIRLWSKNEVLVQSAPPEIVRSDLSSLVLECAEWGAKDWTLLNWFTPPPKGAWNAAKSLLETLGCLKDGVCTPLGKAVLSMGLGVRLSCVALSGFASGNEDFSTRIASEIDGSVSGNKAMQEKLALNLKKRGQLWKNNPQVFIGFPQNSSQFSTAYALLEGFPDRLGKIQPDCTYIFPSGRAARLYKKESVPFPDYLVATEIDAGERQGIIQRWESVGTDEALAFMEKRSKTFTKVSFVGESQKIRKTECTCYGKIILHEKNMPVGTEDYVRAVAEKVRTEGIRWLPLSKASESLLLRCRFYAQQTGDGGNMGTDSLSEKLLTLEDKAEDWLLPFFPEGERVNEENVYLALSYYLDSALINREVPEHIILPNGKKRKISYEEQNGKIIPVLEIIIQQIFGCFETPRVMGEPVLLRLLSPARRPLQVTRDLEHFWTGTWVEICSEMKGRYPKHNWDYRVTTSEE